jgi:hypothetical protein
LNIQSVQAARRPVVIVPADVAPDFERPAELHMETTFKMSPFDARHELPPISTSTVTGTPYATASPIALSPTAPKRARRKPVPRLEEDPEAVEA